MASKPADFSTGQNNPSLRIVLIGGRELKGSKSSTGNFILGESVFDNSKRTAQSVVRQRHVLGRQVTVVDTPGWWWHFTRKDTPKLDQLEIQNSVHLCPPGPDAFLLVIPFDIYLSQICKTSFKEHLKFFGAEVYRHTIVLLTSEVPCPDKNVEFKIKTSSTLQWILQMCGDRKHVLNINNKEDSMQVLKLFEKIEAMVSHNRETPYTVDAAHGNAIRETIRTLSERASERVNKVEKQRKKLKALIEGGKAPPPHLRLVLIGAQWAARSSAGNTILGRNAFCVNDHSKRTMRGEIVSGMVQGRRLTVVDSPGWLYNNSLQDSNEMDKLEIEDSMYLCPPGPHAVLLVIVLATAINTSYQNTVREHVSLFTDDIWKHTLVLFTRGDWLGVKTVEERIESEKGLQWLVNKCGNRYHVLNNMDHSNKRQVKELLDKIEEMVAGNDVPHYEVDQGRAAQIEKERDAAKKKAKRLKKMTERQSRMLKELFEGEKQPMNDIRVVLVGRKGSGKSAAGNLMLFNEVFETDFTTVWFKKYKGKTATCVKQQGNFDGVKITVVEAPGWYIDMTTPDWLQNELLHSVSMCAPGPHAFLLVVPISKAFTERDYKAFVELLMPFTEKAWRHCMVLFTWGDWLNECHIEEYIASEGKALQWLVGKCGNRYHVLSECQFGDPAPVKGLLQKILNMVTQNKGCFSTEEKQRKFSILRRQTKQPMLTEEEWNKREQMLVDRMLKALAKEPEEPMAQAVTMAHSIDDLYIPSMSGDAPSEYRSTTEFRKERAHNNVAEWLKRRMKHSDTTSGIGTISSFGTNLERLEEHSLKDDPQTASPAFPEKEIVVTSHAGVFLNAPDVKRRNSC
ncbi:unnamed protein product [Menidia menidia]|uniref:GTPase IMAP family member 8 n=1 Tax=Menidia menidia TaxID=238744 RepID=A0A8S4B0F6_9TELE|nr:unnamed protein product [Menidia menidia]